ncbi:glycosyltransferase family 4 protein [Fusobacterium sp.]|uniref:Glycosyltransferase WbuB n=1 Tax=Fusobacterium nucleatum TaxID=851 RepID=A0A323TVI8_FUSNU|nr:MULTISPECIES: glycosyltransferase family 4 protein [Fusobacterium]MBS5186044.1 glycosyltransferase family 4 protein [Fusobacterium nucleatum]PCR85654.1 glycosyltransferase WbuB [Fusobacterium nucleatum]PZA04565.1 glycosyltransferase WbuB [Fusobacterium nucleatum]QJX49599.1 glycosyltransferase family 4 protein [Fusobacterium nucleatum]HCE32899.1 glycosyltransferase WbuB [Fusobacterium sp.]
MKNIWFINEHDAPPEFEKTRRRYDMCKYLLRLGKYKLHIICGAFLHGSQNKYAYDKNQKKNVNIDGVDVHILKGVKYSSNIKRIFSMLIFMLRVIFFKFPKDDKPDIIYGSSPHLFAALGALILAKKNKAKYILEIRDLWPETWVQMKIIKKNGIIHKFFLKLEKYLYEKADKVIFLGENFNYILSLGIDKNKVYTISNGVDLEEFDKNMSSPIKLNAEKFNITYTGSIGTANNLDELLDLAKLIDNDAIIFNIVGRGPLKEHLENRIQEEKISNIRFYDPIDKTLVPSLLRSSQALIILLLDIELYQVGISPNKLFEYFASSRPILFYGNTVSDYVARSNSGISVPAGEILKLRDACLKLYNMSAEEREELGRNGRNYVEENFDWRVLANKVDQIIESV